MARLHEWLDMIICAAEPLPTMHPHPAWVESPMHPLACMLQSTTSPHPCRGFAQAVRGQSRPSTVARVAYVVAQAPELLHVLVVADADNGHLAHLDGVDQVSNTTPVTSCGNTCSTTFTTTSQAVQLALVQRTANVRAASCCEHMSLKQSHARYERLSCTEAHACAAATEEGPAAHHRMCMA